MNKFKNLIKNKNLNNNQYLHSLIYNSTYDIDSFCPLSERIRNLYKIDNKKVLLTTSKGPHIEYFVEDEIDIILNINSNIKFYKISKNVVLNSEYYINNNILRKKIYQAINYLYIAYID